MSKILIKTNVYLEPCPQACFENVRDVCAAWYVEENSLVYENDVLQIVYEGIYFPHEEVAEILGKYSIATSDVKLDYIDLEAWTLTRYLFDKKSVYSRVASLNHAIEASQQKSQEYKHTQ